MKTIQSILEEAVGYALWQEIRAMRREEDVYPPEGMVCDRQHCGERAIGWVYWSEKSKECLCAFHLTEAYRRLAQVRVAKGRRDL